MVKLSDEVSNAISAFITIVAFFIGGLAIGSILDVFGIYDSDDFDICCDGCNIQIDSLLKNVDNISIPAQAMLVIPCWKECADKYLEDKK